MFSFQTCSSKSHILSQNSHNFKGFEKKKVLLAKPGRNLKRKTFLSDINNTSKKAHMESGA